MVQNEPKIVTLLLEVLSSTAVRNYEDSSKRSFDDSLAQRVRLRQGVRSELVKAHIRRNVRIINGPTSFGVN
jgi:hypothetical protein